MFVDEALEPVEFKSCWKKERSLADNETQTKDLATQEVAVQAMKRKHREVQTDESGEKEVDIREEDSPELAQFLRHIEPIIRNQLQQNLRSHAFDGYEVTWEDETDTVSNIYTLQSDSNTDNLQITSLSWNCTGSTIAAAYGRFDHEDWCTHRSSLSTWNIDRRNINVNKPDSSLDITSCLMCISFHPVKPSWVVGGTFNGEVTIWDLNKEDEMVVASSGIGDDSHREPVCKVQWIPDPESKGKKFHVVSVSQDGKMLIWRISSHKNALKLVDGHILLVENLPREMRARAKRGDQEMGITCISFSKEDNTNFLMGSESGGVFRCSTSAKGAPASSHVVSSIPLRSPVTFAFDAHFGPVYSVDASPYHRNLFLSCSSDNTARIYSMLQTSPLMTIEPSKGYLFSAKWSPVRPLVFAVGTQEGSLLLYDLKHSQGAPMYKLDVKEKSPIYNMQFNQSKLLATGDGDGRIRIWRLSDDLTNQDPLEVDALDEIAGSALE